MVNGFKKYFSIQYCLPQILFPNLYLFFSHFLVYFSFTFPFFHSKFFLFVTFSSQLFPLNPSRTNIKQKHLSHQGSFGYKQTAVRRPNHNVHNNDSNNHCQFKSLYHFLCECKLLKNFNEICFDGVNSSFYLIGTSLTTVLRRLRKSIAYLWDPSLWETCCESRE